MVYGFKEQLRVEKSCPRGAAPKAKTTLRLYRQTQTNNASIQFIYARDASENRNCNSDHLKLNGLGILADMPLPSAKSKPQEQKDQKKQKSLLGWLSKPADTQVANSSSKSVVRNAPITSSSPSGRESIFETPSVKKRTTLGADTPAIRSANFTKSSDGGTSFNETPPTSDPIDVDMSSDEDVPGRGIKSVCGTCTYMHIPLLLTMVCITGSHKTENCYRGFG